MFARGMVPRDSYHVAADDLQQLRSKLELASQQVCHPWFDSIRVLHSIRLRKIETESVVSRLLSGSPTVLHLSREIFLLLG